MKHIPFNVLDIRKAKQDAIDKKVMEETYALKQAEMKERRREAAALTIQRVYRGHVNRIQTKAFLELRHQFLDLRVLDQPYRNSVLYQLLEYFGYAPLLKSDTPLEKAKHLFPGYMHATVTSCIEGKWSLGCQHIHAVEKHKLTSGEITRTAVMVKLFGVWRARSAVSSAARHTAKKRQLEELHSTNYQNVFMFSPFFLLNGIVYISICAVRHVLFLQRVMRQRKCFMIFKQGVKNCWKKPSNW